MKTDPAQAPILISYSLSQILTTYVPSTGKTLLAQAIAGELKLPILKMAATELISGISGESESNIRDVFEQARSLAPCIIFMDEIDSITPKRENASKEMERRIVAQLLACIDGKIPRSGIRIFLCPSLDAFTECNFYRFSNEAKRGSSPSYRSHQPN